GPRTDLDARQTTRLFHNKLGQKRWRCGGGGETGDIPEPSPTLPVAALAKQDLLFAPDHHGHLSNVLIEDPFGRKGDSFLPLILIRGTEVLGGTLGALRLFG